MKAVILPELSHYRVTEDGRVISELGNELSQTTDRDGYLRVALNHRQWRSKKIPRRVRAYVHILVAGAFHGPCPEGMQVRHLDHDKSNNHKDNLAYGTPSENAQDRVRAGNHGSRAGRTNTNGPSNEMMVSCSSRFLPLRVTLGARQLLSPAYFGVRGPLVMGTSSSISRRPRIWVPSRVQGPFQCAHEIAVAMEPARAGRRGRGLDLTLPTP